LEETRTILQCDLPSINRGKQLTSSKTTAVLLQVFNREPEKDKVLTDSQVIKGTPGFIKKQLKRIILGELTAISAVTN
jgi:hypothetical protein